MHDEYFQHPRRFPKNVEGPFYTTGQPTYAPGSGVETNPWCGDCLWCGAPEAEAPDLLAPLTKENSDTYFIRQPLTPDEIECACCALSVCCAAALRYGGKDKAIIQRLNDDPEFCDFVIDSDGKVIPAVDSQGNLLPFAQEIVAKRSATRQHQRLNDRFKRILNWLFCRS